MRQVEDCVLDTPRPRCFLSKQNNDLSEELDVHLDEVIHVSFSNSGKDFVTCSEDGYLIVWDIHQGFQFRFSERVARFFLQANIERLK